MDVLIYPELLEYCNLSRGKGGPTPSSFLCLCRDPTVCVSFGRGHVNCVCFCTIRGGIKSINVYMHIQVWIVS